MKLIANTAIIHAGRVIACPGEAFEVLEETGQVLIASGDASVFEQQPPPDPAPEPGPGAQASEAPAKRRAKRR